MVTDMLQVISIYSYPLLDASDTLSFVTGMLHDCLASIDCRTRIFKIDYPNESIFNRRGEILLIEVVTSLLLWLVE